MKKTKAVLRVWLASISMGGFLGGWILLAHSPKPASSANPVTNANVAAIDPLPTLAPLPPIGSSVSPGGLSLSVPTIRSRAFMPVFRSGGS
jgi:hypothetical protein